MNWPSKLQFSRDSTWLNELQKFSYFSVVVDFVVIRKFHCRSFWNWTVGKPWLFFGIETRINQPLEPETFDNTSVRIQQSEGARNILKNCVYRMIFVLFLRKQFRFPDMSHTEKLIRILLLPLCSCQCHRKA